MAWRLEEDDKITARSNFSMPNTGFRTSFISVHMPVTGASDFSQVFNNKASPVSGILLRAFESETDCLLYFSGNSEMHN